MGQFVGAVKGIGAACVALDMPIVSGNVSLYNETDGQAILPTPTIGAVGLIDGPEHLIAGQVCEGDVALLVGGEGAHLGQSALLVEAFGREDGDAPHVDLELERRHGEFVRSVGGLVNAATDLSDGGLALAAFELAEAASLGVTLITRDIPALFGEDQARYLLACPAENLDAINESAAAQGVPIARVGSFGGGYVKFGEDSAPLTECSQLFRSAFADAVSS